jgi:microcystin-dependent protein
MAEPFVAEIRAFGFNFPPTGWASCDGQILPISQNTALFSLLGTTYGGDGRTTFGLPNLQARAPLGFGQGPGLTGRSLGEQGGAATVTLISPQLPGHSHVARARGATGGVASPEGSVFGAAQARAESAGYHTGGPAQAMADAAIAPVGGSQPHNNMPPYLGLNFCIAMLGMFPPRS